MMRTANKKTDKEMKKKYGDSYKTRAERNRESRQSKNRYDIMQLILLFQKLQMSGQFNQEIQRFSNKENSEFDKFL